MAENIVMVDPLDWDGSRSGSPWRAEPASAALLEQAGMREAAKTLQSDGLRRVKAAQARYLQVTLEVQEVFFEATASQVTYSIQCYTNHDGFVPIEVVRAVIAANETDWFDALNIRRYDRFVDNRQQAELCLLGYIKHEGVDNVFLIAYWSENGETVPGLTLLQNALELRKQNEEKAKLNKLAQIEYDTAVTANVNRRKAYLYVSRWWIRFGLPSIFVLPGLMLSSWWFIGTGVTLLVLAVISFVGGNNNEFFFQSLKGELLGIVGRNKSSNVRLSDYPAVSRKEMKALRRELSS